MKVYFKGWLTALALALAALVMITLASQPVRAAGTWYVAPGGDDSNDCLSSITACGTINGALNKPGFVPGDTILVSTGTYTGTGDEVVLLDKDASLSGGWDASFTTQSGTSTSDGQGARRGITVDSGVTAIVERFTVQNGYSYLGGGIYNDGALTLNNSTVSANTATSGGGIFSDGTLLSLNDSTVSGNTTNGGGGGITSSGTLTLTNSTVSGNTANGTGGGILNYGTLSLANSTVSGNMANVNAGGIFSNGTLALNNSTVSHNTASPSAGGIWNDGGTATLQNTIVAGNMGGSTPDCSGTIGSSGYNLVGDTSGCTFTPGTGDLTNIDAKLGPLQDNGGPTETHALLPGSPAIDAGDDSACPATDQRGVPRPQGGQCDIGAYEALLLNPSTKTVNKSTASPGDPLTYTIALNNGETLNITNVRVTDTLPISLTYINNSLTATSGSYGYANRVITWTGSVTASGAVTIKFGATVSQTVSSGISITNSAVISGGGETITRTATVIVQVEQQMLYLPVILKNW